MIEIWRAGGSATGFSPAEARAVEAEGWDGQMFMDSQCLSADPWVLMGAWAGATEHLRLSPGVTNPFTRKLAVTAASALSVQAISGGRAVLGIGRGDSALAWLGHGPVPVRRFEAALVQLQALLTGGEVAFEEGGEGAPSVHSLSLGARPTGVKLQWLDPALPKVPLDVAATGPRVIEIGARHAERVTFSLGADPGRVGWAVEKARSSAGGKPVSLGVQVVLVCHPDRDEAMDVAMQMVPPLARFQVMQGEAAGPSGKGDAADYATIRSGYDMTKHAGMNREKLTQGSLSPEFVEGFGVVGTPDQCAARLLALRALGIERFVLVGPGFYPAHWGEAASLPAREILPALRAG